MHYKELIKSYHSQGFGSEKKMWECIYALEDAMMCLKDKDPGLYDETMRDLHEVFCGPHYNEYFAKMDVSGMCHKNKAGQEEKGEHWNMHQVSAFVKGISISGNANIWDVYVALNANWHDKDIKFMEWFGADHEKKIIEDAVSFYFMDEDGPKEGKIWEYMCAMDD